MFGFGDPGCNTTLVGPSPRSKVVSILRIPGFTAEFRSEFQKKFSTSEKKLFNHTNEMQKTPLCIHRYIHRSIYTLYINSEKMQEKLNERINEQNMSVGLFNE